MYKNKYIKYKAKYLLLRKDLGLIGGNDDDDLGLIGGNDDDDLRPNITIDGIKFTLIEKYIDFDNGYNFVTLKSVDENEETTIFSCYQSKSEGGIYRLCVSGARQLVVKGFHYITASFIHIELQAFINNNINEVELSKENISGIPHRYCNKKLENDSNVEKVIDHLYNIGRVTADEQLNAIQSCKAGVCFNNYPISSMILNASDDKYTKELKALIRLTTDGTMGADTMKRIFDTISYYVSQYFLKVDEEDTRIGELDFRLIQGGFEVLFNHVLYVTKIENKESGKKYKLLWSNYNLRTNPERDYNGYNRIILNVIPDDAKITKYGTYSNVVKAGVYTYKIFEYAKQLGPYLGDEYGRTVGDYKFIGDFQTNMWPFIREDEISNLDTLRKIEQGKKHILLGRDISAQEDLEKNIFNTGETIPWDEFKTKAKNLLEIEPEEWDRCSELKNKLAPEGSVTVESYNEALKWFLPINSTKLINLRAGGKTLYVGHTIHGLQWISCMYVGHTIHEIEWILNEDWWCDNKEDFNRKMEALTMEENKFFIRKSSHVGSFVIGHFDLKGKKWNNILIPRAHTSSGKLKAQVDLPLTYGWKDEDPFFFKNLPTLLAWYTNLESKPITAIDISRISN